MAGFSDKSLNTLIEEFKGKY
jgi:hypothetical protein